MSLFLDQKYLSLISNRLPLFSKKKDNTYNCRCIICGDSIKKTRKARGYFFAHKNNLMYKCFNCDASMQFGTFLKNLDSLLYRQYVFESYTEGKPLSFSNNDTMKFEQPEFKKPEEKLLDKLLDRLDKLPDDNEAVQYCITRKIPKNLFNRLYYINDIRDIVQLNSQYKESIKTSEPRLIIPFYNEEGQLTGVTCRALRGEALRYITVKIKQDDALIFGLEEVDKTKLVYVVEGPIDSLFIENSIALGGTSASKLSLSTVPKENMVLIFDNQPRNKELIKIINKNIDLDYKVVIWPQTIEEKDINEMVIANRNISNIIKQNTFSGLEAKLKLTAWKRV